MLLIRVLRTLVRATLSFTKVMSHLNIFGKRKLDRCLNSAIGLTPAAPSRRAVVVMESFPLFEEDWFTEEVLRCLDSYDLLDCSLVNRHFMRTSRKLMHGYKMTSSRALSCLNERIALADSLTLYFGDVTTDLLSFRDLPTFKHLTSLRFESKQSSLGFSYSRYSEVTQLKHLQVWSLGLSETNRLTAGLLVLKNLRSLRIAQDSIVNLADLCTLSRLTHLELENCVIGADEFWTISKLINLECLSLVYPDNLSFDNAFPYLGQLSNLKELKITNLGCSRKFLREVVLQMKKLTTLYLAIIEWGTEVLDFSVLSTLPMLRDLTISFEFDIADLTMNRIWEISTLQKVKGLMTKSSAKFALPCLQRLPCFKELVCDDLLSLEQDPYFPDMSEFTQLTKLELSQANSEALRIVSALTNLETLLITEGSDPVTSWAPISTLKKLRCLHVHGAQVKLAHLPSHLAHLKQLQDLSISRSSPLKGKAFEFFSHLSVNRNFTSLKMLLSLEDDPVVLFGRVSKIFALHKLEICFLPPVPSLDDSILQLTFLKRLRWLTMSSADLKDHQEQLLLKSLPLLRRITKL
eukprot:g5748.t1